MTVHGIDGVGFTSGDSESGEPISGDISGCESTDVQLTKHQLLAQDELWEKAVEGLICTD